ncbi:hypothetical protein M3152_13475 [Sporosarcina luteola]|uniref:hypothetical protein n=1 Tax=Bacillales TaxID=1385 RepID=UPI002040EAC5|nr:MULTISPECIES: hypothetical protein [Bacillales]MCM3638711.1 hypothetical protein [Sporosarcina luteola]
MALFPEDTNDFDYEANGYFIYDNVTSGNITGARINIKYDRAIAISFKHGNTLGKCKGSLKECYDLAIRARSIYATAFRQHFPVSAKAMAWEIWLHAAPEALDTMIDNKIVRLILGTTLAGKISMAIIDIVGGHTDYADIGITDGQRKFDKFFEEAYDLLF